MDLIYIYNLYKWKNNKENFLRQKDAFTEITEAQLLKRKTQR